MTPPPPRLPPGTGRRIDLPGADQFALVPALAEDAPRLADLRVAAMRSSLEAVGRFDPIRARARFMDGFCVSDTVILQSGRALAGFYVLRQREDHVYLDHLYITPALQGRGLGRARRRCRSG